MSAVDAAPSIEKFRADATEFLQGRLRPRPDRDAPFVWGEGSDSVAITEDTDPEREAEDLAAAKEYAAARFDAGFGWIDGPVELGGRELPASYKDAYRRLEAQYETPTQTFFTIGVGMVGPTLLAHATDEVQRAYVPGLHRGDVLACQLFSEPGAGSDLAAVATRAERDGDEWVLNGQKVWTSNAHVADIGEAICRSDPDLPKHKGITAFVVDMHAPGVEVRPLIQMSGAAGFNEVFLEDVRVPDSHRLGGVGEGWAVATTTLMNERASLGSGMGLGPGPGPFERLPALLRELGLDDDPILRDRLAHVCTDQKVVEWTTRRATARLQAGQLPGPEMSILKLAGTRTLQQIADLVALALGARLAADTGDWGMFAWNDLVCGMPGARLGGGSDEVLHNIIGERVLGLPKEPAIDPSTPFKDLPR